MLTLKSLDFLNNIIENKTALLILSSKFLNEWELQEHNNEIIAKCHCFMKYMFLALVSHVLITTKISF